MFVECQSSNDSWPKQASVKGSIKKCSLADTENLNKCLKNVLEELRPRIAQGIPELNLPALNPLMLDKIEFNHGSGPVKLSSTMQDVIVTGLHNYSKVDFW